MNNIKVIGFDADDTLWVNEPYFRETEKEFWQVINNGKSLEETTNELFRIEIGNIPLYGYGTKAFTLSMIETAIKITNGNISSQQINAILELGKEQIQKPIELIDGIEEVLQFLHKKYKLIVATKGDLLDQERKLQKSGLLKYFHHIEVMTDKKEVDYVKLIKHLDIQPDEFLMVGNSLKSDVLPVVNLGGKAAHVPFHTTWIHEEADKTELEKVNFFKLNHIGELVHLMNSKQIEKI